MHGKLPRSVTRTRTRRGRRFVVSALVLIAVAGALYWVYHGTPTPQRRPGRFAATGPVPVLVATAMRADVPVYLTTVGTARALNTVTVRPQVDGKLISVNFKEGQDVKKGDLLAKIDPTIYQAQYDQVVAKKAQDEAQLANAKNDLERYEKLAAANAINKQQADTQRALVAQYSALVQADRAVIENAQATLSYTTITAPISGRTGIRTVDEGNYVRASDSSSAIVTITQIKPIAVLFNLPQQELMRVNQAFAKGPLAVEAQRSDNNKIIDRGTLTVVDNTVDSSTGTVKLKAEFPNADLQLWPGQFTNVRLLIDTLKNVVVIPTGAVQRGPSGTFVYVVGSDDKATMRTIVVQRQDENQAVVKSGVEPPERVVTTGFARLTEGSKVAIASANGAPAAVPAKTGQRPRNGTRRQHEGAVVGSGNGAGQRSGGNRRPPQ
jgi:multidrug efflux system membrane fusion protein